MPRKINKQLQKSTLLGAKMAPKIAPRGFQERLGGLLRASSAPRTFQKRSWRALRKAKEIGHNILTQFGKKVPPKEGGSEMGRRQRRGPEKPSWRIGRTRLQRHPFHTRSYQPAVVGGFLGYRLCRRPLDCKLMTTEVRVSTRQSCGHLTFRGHKLRTYSYNIK